MATPGCPLGRTTGGRGERVGRQTGCFLTLCDLGRATSRCSVPFGVERRDWEHTGSATVLSLTPLLPGGVWGGDDGECAQVRLLSLSHGHPLARERVRSPRLPSGGLLGRGLTLGLWEDVGLEGGQGRKFIWQRTWAGPEEGGREPCPFRGSGEDTGGTEGQTHPWATGLLVKCDMAPPTAPAPPPRPAPAPPPGSAPAPSFLAPMFSFLIASVCLRSQGSGRSCRLGAAC